MTEETTVIPFEVHVNMDTGEPLLVSSVPGTIPEEGPISEGSNIHRFLIYDNDINMERVIATYYRSQFDTTRWFTREPRPSEYHMWDTVEERWQVDLDKLWITVRSIRTQKLSATDWTQLPDSNLSEELKTSWATYRTELRNLPQNQSNAQTFDDIAWPTLPE